jgi:hypothetical protein
MSRWTGISPRIVIALLFWLMLPATVFAQDIFEIQVYEWDTVPKNKWSLETHLNFIAKGTKEFDGTAAPTDHQGHLTFELTRGITDHFEMAGYLVLAVRPGGGFDFAGVRLRPRFSIPEQWHWPVDAGLSIEFGFPRPLYEPNSVTLELRPVLEKKLGDWKLDFNPTIGRALRGRDSNKGFDFEPQAKVARFLKLPSDRQLGLGMEYYGSVGALTHFSPLRDQVHIFVPSVDIYLSDKTVWNLGVGMGATAAGERLIFKMRIGHEF